MSLQHLNPETRYPFEHIIQLLVKDITIPNTKRIRRQRTQNTLAEFDQGILITHHISLSYGGTVSNLYKPVGVLAFNECECNSPENMQDLLIEGARFFQDWIPAKEYIAFLICSSQGKVYYLYLNREY
jgi:hypothetical protein